VIHKIRIVFAAVVLVTGLLAVSAIPTIGHEDSPDAAPIASVVAFTPPLPTPRPVVNKSAPIPVTNVVVDTSIPARIDPKYKPYPAYVFTPTGASERGPLQVVVALHGMGGEGKSFGGLLAKEAEKHNWLLVAPTIGYGDWKNPDVVAEEEVETTQRLAATIDQLSALTGLKLKPLVHIYGFSRGAQLAHRFAMFFPERVDEVAAFSAGTYTLPFRAKDIDGDGKLDTLKMPFGVSDLSTRLGRPLDSARLRQVDFLVGVGGADSAAGDLPRQWDPYLGKTRLDRAGEFVKAMQGEGVPCRLKVFPGAGHEVNQAMITEVINFFASSLTQSSPQLQ
jgi:pimeloyl-ACP methyl ester carboxylesterase